MRRKFLNKLIIFSFAVGALLLATSSLQTEAATIDELKKSIGERENQIKELEAEIARYQVQIDANVSEAKTLGAEIKRLETKIKKLNADVRLTQRKIDATTLTIDKLSAEIGEKRAGINAKKEALGEILKTIYQAETDSIIEVMLKNHELSDFFSDLEYIGDLESSVQYDLDTLKILKAELEDRQGKAVNEKQKLTKLEEELLDRKALEETTQKGKSQLLVTTKNKEAEYQKLLKDREAKRTEIAEEIRRVEDELRKLIDPTSLPKPRKGILAWPMKSPKITQTFGLTGFSSARTDVYKNGRHNGIDLSASVGTPIYAAEDGEVKAAGDNDIGCPGGSYGKWVVLTHPNNLATLYAHLSLTRVVAGTKVERGDLIAYSGDTGYTTGPHLHFTVYDARTVELRAQRSCGITPFGGYLDPMIYL